MSLLTVVKILLDLVSLPRTSRLSCLGKETFQSTLFSVMVVDDILQPSNHNTRQLARDYVLFESTARVDHFQAYPTATTEGGCQWAADV